MLYCGEGLTRTRLWPEGEKGEILSSSLIIAIFMMRSRTCACTCILYMCCQVGYMHVCRYVALFYLTLTIIICDLVGWLELSAY